MTKEQGDTIIALLQSIMQELRIQSKQSEIDCLERLAEKLEKGLST